MKREILFKGKRVFTNDWVEGYYILDGKTHRIFEYGLESLQRGGIYSGTQVHPETVCQSFDCGSGSFYEDDKVMYNGKEYIVKFHLSFATLERTLFEHGENESVFINEDVAYLMKIIGNIHD